LLFTIAGERVIRDERLYDSLGIVERLQKARLDTELRTAAEVQRALLSQAPRIGPFYRAAGDSIPCRAIGGDFFEFVELPSGSLGILMGDVAGKGPAAALLAAMIQGMFAADPDVGSPASLLDRINRRLLVRDLAPKFATLVYAVLSPNGRLIYSNAGHNPPVLVTSNGTRRLTVGGPIVGAIADASFLQGSYDLQPGDTLVMFTDGVTEAVNGNDADYGEEGLLTSLSTAAGAEPIILLERILSAVWNFCGGIEQHDDITVAVTRFG
jgi:sigma-B regulation protein RsbU (phosphoserine phosphatase)